MVWLKRLAIFVLALVACVAAAITYVMVFVDPNDFKQELQAVAADQANIQLRLDGDIRWSFYPWLGLELADIGVALGNDPELVRFGKAEFGLAILPLFSQTIQVDRVKIIDLNASLTVAPDGRGNWLPAAPTGADSDKTQTSSAKVAVVTEPPAQADAFELPDIQLDELLIENAHIQYRDVPNDLQASATLNLQLGDVRWDQAWPLLLDIVVEQNNLAGTAPLTATAALGADLTVFPQRQALSLEQLTLKTQLSAAFLPKSPLVASLALAQLGFDLPQENLLIDGLQLSSLGVELAATIEAYQVLSAPSFEMELTLAQLNPRNVLAALAIELPPMSDDTALTALAAQLSLSGDSKQIHLNPLALQLDDSQISATATVDLAPLYWDLIIQGNSLDLDRYLPPKSETEAVADSSNETPEAVAEPATELLPVALLRSLNGRVRFAWEDLKVLNLQLDSLNLHSTQANGLLQVAPFKAALYQGEVLLDADLDVRKAQPKITLQPSVSKVQIQPLLQDFMDLDMVAGATFIKGDLTLRGNSVEALMQQLNGDLLIDIKQGALVGTNITKTVCEGIAATRSASLDEAAWGQDTPFERLAFPARIVNGVASTPGLTISAAGLTITGDGVISLPESSLHYQADVSLSGSTLDSACRVKQKFSQLAFPIVCKGKFSDDPAGLCRPDLKGFGDLFADLAKAELEAKVAERVAQEKAHLAAKVAQQKAALAQEKAALEAEVEAQLASQKAKLKAEEARLKAEWEAKKQAEEEAAKLKLQEKLKNSLKSLF